MEDATSENKGKKRARYDSDLDSPEVKRVDSEDLEFSSPVAMRVRTDSDVNSAQFGRADSPESGRIPNDILDILDEPDTVADPGSAIQDLDSVIKSFEEEILNHSPPQLAAEVVVSSECGEPQPDLGYLLEASDDELGLPPTVSPLSDEQTKTKIESADFAVGLSESLGFEDEFPSYDSLGFGIGEETQFNDTELVTVGGLFDYDSADFSEFLYRSESLHAL